MQIAGSRFGTVWEYSRPGVESTVLKVAHERSQGAFECLDREVSAYNAARQLQGSVLPTLYNFGCVHTVRSLRGNACSDQAVPILFL